MFCKNRLPITHTPVHAKEGFLLIEAISAVALCMVISFLIAHYQATMLIWYHDGSQRLRAITLVQNYCEQYKAQAQAAYRAPAQISEMQDSRENSKDNNKQDNNFVITQELLPTKQPGFFPARITIMWQSMQNKQEKIVVYTSSSQARLCA